MTDRPDVRIVGDERHVTDVELDLGDAVIGVLARTARRHDVMITISITPFDVDEDETDDATS